MNTSNKHIWHITYPILMTLLAQNVINVTNTAFLGRVGEIELGASAIGGIFYIAIFMACFGFSMGSQILIGRRNGEKNYLEIGKIFNNGLFFSFLLAIVIFIFSQSLISPILGAIVKSKSIYTASVEYLNWRAYGFFFLFMNVMFRAFFVGITQTKVLSISALVTAVVNILFDYILIFGKLGLPAMGIKGAAIASVIAEAATTIYLLTYTFNKVNRQKYGLFSFRKIEFDIIKKTLDISVYIMFQYSISVSTWFLFFIFIERTGERALAVSNIVRSLYAILIIPASALGTTTSTMISNLIGEGRSAEVLRFLKKVITINAVLSIPFVLFTLVFPELCIRIYTPDTELISATIPVVRLVSFSILVFGTGLLLFNSVSATGNTRIAFTFELVVLSFYILYTYLTTTILHSPIQVVWIAEYVYWGMIAVVSFVYLKYGNWRKIVI